MSAGAASRWFAAALGALMGAAALPAAGAECRLALALGHDVSGSVDRSEYDLQLRGLALALEAPAVRRALLAMPEATVRLYVYEWSGTGRQTQIIPWTEITSAGDIDVIVDILTLPTPRPRVATTALGDAMLFGALALEGQQDCWARTLDISGDGASNIGIEPAVVQLSPMLDGVTINALVIANDTSRATVPRRRDSAEYLVPYFRDNVLRGPDAFIELAIGYDDYAEAMARKLLREVRTMVVGAVAPRGR